MHGDTDTHSLGSRIKRLRQQNDWSLNELAERSGIAVSTLSKVENGLLSLSYDRLLSVSTAFDLSLAEFLSEAENDPTSVGSRPQANGRLTVERSGNIHRIDTENCGYEYLCTRIRHKSVTPLVVEIKARSIEEFGELIRHEGEELMYVLSGEVELHTEYYGPEVLREGDSAYIDSEMGHACIRLSDEPAFILNAMTSVQHIGDPED